jgi:hypothetical protein
MMKRYIFTFLLVFATSTGWAQIKVVYHLSEGIPQAIADPTSKLFPLGLQR